MRRGDPAGQAVGDVTGIAMRGDALAEVAAGVDAAGVVDAGADVKAAVVDGAGQGDGLLEAVAGGGAGRAVADHLDDVGARAGRLDQVVLVAGRGAVVVLHQAWVADAPVCRRCCWSGVSGGCWCGGRKEGRNDGRKD